MDILNDNDKKYLGYIEDITDPDNINEIIRENNILLENSRNGINYKTVLILIIPTSESDDAQYGGGKEKKGKGSGAQKAQRGAQQNAGRRTAGAGGSTAGYASRFRRRNEQTDSRAALTRCLCYFLVLITTRHCKQLQLQEHMQQHMQQQMPYHM